MTGKKPQWIGGIGAVLAVAAFAVWRLAETPAPDSHRAPDRSRKLGEIQTPPPAPQPASPTNQKLQSAANELAAAQTSDGKMETLARLRQTLASGSTNEISNAIRRFLDTKIDAPTGQGFKIGGNGSLLEAPTLRTFLLDQLALTDPAAAAGYARVILDSSASPDEWAIALRNLARGDTGVGARTLLETKTGELLGNQSWRRDPSAGYLEAFDTVVYLGGTALVPPLSEMVRDKDNRAVAHAAFLTLDRLVINQPAEMLSILNQNPDWMKGREETRANYFARADVIDPIQRQLVESYLLDPARKTAELQAFAGVFPNANFMISQNLLTSNTTLDGATLSHRDQGALAVVNAWLAEPRFEKVTPTLEKMRSRLMKFTRQADDSTK